jgi:hypothetical protein
MLNFLVLSLVVLALLLQAKGLLPRTPGYILILEHVFYV